MGYIFIMSDDLKKKGRGDDIRINIHQQHEVDFWTRELKTNSWKLKQAVKAVGPMVKDVKNWLAAN